MTLLVIILALLLLREMLACISIARSVAWVRRHRIGSRVLRRKFIILIPAYQEEAVIERTLEYFSLFVERNVRVYVVTTARETGGGTLAAARRFMRRHRHARIGLVQYPHATGRKAAQINYAVRLLTERFGEDVFFAIYDADSRPERDVLRFIDRLEDSEHNLAYQQYPAYFLGYERKSVFMQAAAVFQSRRTLYYELPNTLAQVGLIEAGKHRLTDPHYCIGHGLVIHGSLLRRSPLPEEAIIEDLVYGYRLFFSRIKVVPVPSFDNCEVPARPADLFIQSSVWYAGETEIGMEFRRGKRPVLDRVRFWKRLLKNMDWLLHTVLYGALPLAALLIAPAAALAYLAAWLLLLWWEAAMILGFFHERRLAPQRTPSLRLVLSLALRYALNGIGPMRAAFRSRTSIYRKTPRAAVS